MARLRCWVRSILVSFQNCRFEMWIQFQTKQKAYWIYVIPTHIVVVGNYNTCFHNLDCWTLLTLFAQKFVFSCWMFLFSTFTSHMTHSILLHIILVKHFDFVPTSCFFIYFSTMTWFSFFFFFKLDFTLKILPPLILFTERLYIGFPFHEIAYFPCIFLDSI